MPNAKRRVDNSIDISNKQKKLRKVKNIYLKDVLVKNKEQNLYSAIFELAKTAEDDPPVIFGWENVELFVAAINTAQAANPAPPPLPLGLNLPANLDVQGLKLAILRYARIPNSAPPLGTTALPCTLAQYGYCVGRLYRLDADPWTAHIKGYCGANTLPVATVYFPKARSDTLEYATEAIHNSLWR